MTEIQFKHEPVLLHEVLAWLDPAAGGVFADGTLGGGGHSEGILRLSGGTATLYGIDRDEDAIRAWRAQDEHGLVRETGRRAWYTRYMLQIARVERSYSWDSDEEYSDAEPATA